MLGPVLHIGKKLNDSQFLAKTLKVKWNKRCVKYRNISHRIHLNRNDKSMANNFNQQEIIGEIYSSSNQII